MARVDFIEPMLLLTSEALPDGWLYELKLDGYRAIAFKTGGTVQLRSRDDNDFSQRYRAVAKALAGLPADTVIDGEIVALHASGRPSFNTLQNFKTATVVFYVFDLLVLGGVEVMGEPLTARRRLLEEVVLPRLSEPVRYSVALEAPLPALIQSVRAQGLEGLVAKRLDSKYEPGQRSGTWRKM